MLTWWRCIITGRCLIVSLYSPGPARRSASTLSQLSDSFNYLWARPRGAQLSAGYTIFSAFAATILAPRRIFWFHRRSIPLSYSAPRCDLLRTDRRTDTRHDCDRHDLPASHSSSTQLKGGKFNCSSASTRYIHLYLYLNRSGQAWINNLIT